MADLENELEKIEKRLKSLEKRLGRLESASVLRGGENLDNYEEKVQTSDQSLNSDLTDEEEKGLESQIGRIGLAWLGNIVLLFGFVFLIQLLMIQGHNYYSILLGYVSAGLIYLLANYLKKSNVHLAFMFKMNAQILLFYITLKLHFFTNSPLLSNKTISLILLLLLIALQGYLSFREKSQAFAALSVIFALTTGIAGDSANIILPLVFLTAAGCVYYYYRFNWKHLLIAAIILTYSSAFIWLLGNPVVGHPLKLIPLQNSGVIYFLGVSAVYSIPLLLRRSDGSADNFLTGITLLNGILYTLLLIFVALGFFSKTYVVLFSVITIACLIYSIILHSRYEWNFASAFYALYGFMAMSIALFGLYGFPKVYLLLSVQSLVVVSMALWFRNRVIVIMNSILFLIILLIYLFSSKSVEGANISFALISLISARVINWKHSRLQIKTDMIRNLYMIEGFFMVLFALFHAIPRQFVTFSWTIAALLYFLISLLLKNVKYRYMALGTLICAAVYLFIVDLARIELIYRVLALLFLAALSIGISIYYTQRIKKPDN